MKNSKLVKVLCTFSAKELKEFEKIVSSAYFNRGRNYSAFLNQLKKFAPKYDSENLNHEFIFSKMYPGKKFNRQLIWNMSSALFNMAEEYLLQLALHGDKFTKQYLIAGELLHRRLPALYEKQLNEIEKQLESPGIGARYFLNRIQLSIARKAYYFFEDKQYLLSQHIREKAEYSIMYFLENLSKAIADMKSNTAMFNARFEPDLPYEILNNMNIGNLLKYAGEHNFPYTWMMEMFYCLIMINLDNGSTEHFFRLRELFESNYEKFTEDEKLSWVISLTNFSAQKAAYEYDFKKILFEINKFQLREEIGLTKRKMPKILFLQILRNALSINETEWVKNYIEEFVPKLKQSYQKPMRAFGLAYLNLELKNYEQVLENLANVRFVDDRDKLYAKSIYLRVYFDMKETDALLSEIDSTLHFVNNSVTVRESTAEMYRKTLSILKKLVYIREREDYSELGALRKIIENDKEITFRKWFFEKIAELESKKVKSN